MAKQVTLHDLIDMVREELLTPRKIDSAEDLYPYLFVDEVELELTVALSDEWTPSGKLSFYVLEVGLGGKEGEQRGHKVKIKMSPLVDKEEMRALLKSDERLWKKFEEISKKTLLKGDEEPQGTPE